MGKTVWFYDARGRQTYAQIISRMKKVLDREMTVLELACGTGLLAVQFAGSMKLLEATDFSEGMIRQAKAKAHSSPLHFSVQDEDTSHGAFRV